MKLLLAIQLLNGKGTNRGRQLQFPGSDSTCICSLDTIFICHHQLNKWLRGFLHIAVFGWFLSLSGMPSHRYNVTRKFAFCGGWPQEVKSVCGAFSPVLERATEISVVNCIVEFQKSIYFTPFTENETALQDFSATYAPRPIVTLAPCSQPVAVPAARTTSTSFFHQL